MKERETDAGVGATNSVDYAELFAQATVEAHEHGAEKADIEAGLMAYAATERKRPLDNSEEISRGLDLLLEGIDVASDSLERTGVKELLLDAAQEALHADETAIKSLRALARRLTEHDQPSPEMDETLQRVESLKDNELTSLFIAKMADRSEDSLLASARQRLHQEHADELPYELRVLGADSGLFTADKQERDAKLARWSTELGGGEDHHVPPVFVAKGDPESPPVLVLSRDVAEAVLDEISPVHPQAVKALQHEYGHTQRTFTPAGGLGRNFEELGAIETAGGQSVYMEAVVARAIMSAAAEGAITAKFKEVVRGESSVNDLYAEIADKIGPRSALAMAVISPPPYKIDPELMGAFELGRTQTDALMATIREDLESHRTGRFEQVLESLPEVPKRVFIERMSVSGVQLSPAEITAMTKDMDAEEQTYWVHHYGEK